MTRVLFFNRPQSGGAITISGPFKHVFLDAKIRIAYESKRILKTEQGVTMEYRLFGKTGVSVSVLGFGMMRLPILNNDSGQINKAEATRMVRSAIDQGVNYIDTAYGYHKGQSEIFTREVLGDGYREKVFLATKMPTYLVKEETDFERFFQEQKEKLGANRIDMYLLHTLNQERWDLINDLKVIDFLEKKRKAGEIRFFGFSFHDDYPAFETIVNAYDWDFCQIQYNYMDTQVQAGLRGLQLAHDKGMAVIVMEPIKGGKLANPSPKIRSLLSEAQPDWSPAEWALRWVADFPEVSLILSGMSTMAQAEENVKIAKQMKANAFTEKERAAIEKTVALFRSYRQIPCTECGYCQPCPEGVRIPDIFALYNEGMMFDAMASAIAEYRMFFSPDSKADRCVACGKCESLCPQKLPIIELLKQCEESLNP